MGSVTVGRVRTAGAEMAWAGWIAAAMALPAILPATLLGQSLADRVAVGDGDVSFRFPVRPGVRVCETGVHMGEGRFSGSWRDGYGAGACSEGTATARVGVRDGRVREVELLPALPADAGGSGDAGAAVPRTTGLEGVSAAEAADFFLSLAGTTRSGRVGGSALMAASVVDGVETWPRMLDIARSSDVEHGVRKSALFWVGQAAAEEVTRGLVEVASEGGDDQDLRDAAVFALSQRPAAEAVPVLMELARSAEHAETRKSAMFWLAQKDDARVADFFQEILLGSRTGGGG